MQIAKAALEYLSSPVEHTERIASVPQSLDAGGFVSPSYSQV